MATVYMNKGAGSGAGSDDCTATGQYVHPDYTAIYQGTDDEPANGTMTVKAAETYNVAASDRTIPADQYLGGAQIIKGVQVTGVDAAKMLDTMILKVGDANDDDRLVYQQGSIPTKAAATYNTSTSDQTIAAGQYLGGAQTVKAVTTLNIDAANIKYNVNVRVGDANSATRIKNVTGTYTSDGTVTAAQIRSGYVGYSKGTKYTGTMAVNSATSFSVAQTANNKVRVSCTTPTAATGRPWGGLYVRGKSGSYPTSVSDGFEVGRVGTTGYVDYTNATNMPSGSTIYFRGWDYVYYNENGSTSSYPLIWYGNSHDIGSVYMGASGYSTIKSSGTWTLPTGANRVKFFLVGGGGGGNSASGDEDSWFPGGAGGGYCIETSAQTGTGGSTAYTVTIGAGGAVGKNGGSSSVSVSGSVIATAPGGGKVEATLSPSYGGSGGSGGGKGGGYAGGSNGASGTGAASAPSSPDVSSLPGYARGYGQMVLYSTSLGVAQRNTTFNGVVYAGGGGGAAFKSGQSGAVGGAGGSGGGGRGGASWSSSDGSKYTNGVAGTANTGGGAGATPEDDGTYRTGVAGGSGVVIAYYYKA